MRRKVTVHEVQMNVDIPIDLRDKLDAFCKKRNVEKKAIVELALRRFLDGEDDS